jgi:hypothetical protein
MISPQTVDLQIVGERQGIGKGLASSGERRLSACVGKATARYDIECGISVCEAAEGAGKPEAVERRFIIRMADARKHAGCNSRDTIGASSIASVDQAGVKSCPFARESENTPKLADDNARTGPTTRERLSTC